MSVNHNCKISRFYCECISKHLFVTLIAIYFNHYSSYVELLSIVTSVIPSSNLIIICHNWNRINVYQYDMFS